VIITQVQPLFFAAYAVVGGVVGVLAGLLGIGGGLIVVPALMFLFAAEKLPAPYHVHLAVGTSLATIIFTALASVRAHHAHRAVDWKVVIRMTPGILIGTGGATLLAINLSAGFLKWLFACFVIFVALQMIFGIKPHAAREIPGRSGLFTAGALIGGLSSLVGIGGGSMTVPFLVWCNVTVQRAIATSAAIGLPIALAGSAGYMISGSGVTGLPALCVGFVYLPALLGIAFASMLTAPLGARLAHRLPVQNLKKIFAIFLLIIAARLVWSAMNS